MSDFGSGASSGDAVWPVRWADGNVTRIAAKTAAEFRIANDNERAGFGHLVEIGDALGLRISVMHQPVFAFEVRRRVRVEGLVSVEEDLALLM